MFSNMRLTPVGVAVARGVPTAKARAAGFKCELQPQARPWGLRFGIPGRPPAARNCRRAARAAAARLPAHLQPWLMARGLLIQLYLCELRQNFVAVNRF